MLKFFGRVKIHKIQSMLQNRDVRGKGLMLLQNLQCILSYRKFAFNFELYIFSCHSS